ncbi:MAG: DUF1573 domain-containing protein [Pirellulaceae bacterium]|nr:DUF1573 domain-containing protein [Pirellulaceae bacterium]
MRRSILLLSFIVASCACPVFGQQWAKDMFETTKHDFGTVARGAKAEFKFQFTNRYLEDVHIAGVRSSCGCTQVRVENPAVKTYETGAIVATVNTKAFQGSKGATITVTIDKPYYAEVQLQDTVYIRSDVVFDPGSVALGDIDEGKSATQKVTVNYAGRNDWQVLEVRSTNPHISGEVVQNGRQGGRISYDLVVRVDDKAPVGYVRDHLLLITNDYNLKQVPLLVEGRVQSGITVSPASLFLGVVQPGEKVQKQVVIRGQKPFKILSIHCDDESFQFGPTNSDEAKPLHLVPVTFVGRGSSGKVSRTIHIETDLGNASSDLPAYAVVTDEEE